MLFRRNIEPACSYCRHGRSGPEDEVYCIYRGVMQPWERCRRFAYDPLRRVPEANPIPVTDVDPASIEL